jgi:hypothetical protein
VLFVILVAAAVYCKMLKTTAYAHLRLPGQQSTCVGQRYHLTLQLSHLNTSQQLPTWHYSTPIHHTCYWLQGTREVEGLVFQMTSDLGKLKRKVDMLGSAKDTMQHRCASLL